MKAKDKKKKPLRVILKSSKLTPEEKQRNLFAVFDLLLTNKKIIK